MVDPGTNIVPETDAAPEYDYTVDDQAFAAEQPGKPPPPPLITRYRLFFSILLALE